MTRFWHYSPYLLLTLFVIGYVFQAQADAKRVLRTEEQMAIVDAARRQGKTIVFTSIYDPGTVIDTPNGTKENGSTNSRVGRDWCGPRGWDANGVCLPAR